jgi:hypothetical protein
VFDLRAKLQKEFAGIEIVTLKDMVEKIAVVSKVRVGKERSVIDYDEVTFSDIDKNGIIQINTQRQKPAPANSSAIASQRLHKNDLIVSYRGVDIQVGRIDREYERPVVTNNSAIRIQFAYEDETEEEEVSLFVQTYLQLPYVQAYLAQRPQSREYTRKILSPLFLAELPVPLFRSRHYDLKELLYKRLFLVNRADELSKRMHHLLEVLQEHKDSSLYTSFKSVEKIRDEKRKDEDISQTLKQVAKSLQRLQSLLSE